MASMQGLHHRKHKVIILNIPMSVHIARSFSKPCKLQCLHLVALAALLASWLAGWLAGGLAALLTDWRGALQMYANTFKFLTSCVHS